MRFRKSTYFPIKVTKYWKNLVYDAIDERKDLGLCMPEDFDVSIGILQGNSSAAVASRYGSKNLFMINTFAILYNSDVVHMSKVEEDNMEKLINYSTVVSNCFHRFGIAGKPNEKDVLRCMRSKNPRKAFENMVSKKYTKSEIRDMKEKQELDGFSFEKAIDHLSKGASGALKIIDEIKPLVTKYHSTGKGILHDNVTARHETDHLAFVEGKMYKKIDCMYMNLVEAMNAIADEHSRVPVSVEIANDNQKMVDFHIDSVLLMEAGAHVFNFVPAGGWEKLKDNYIDVKKMIAFELMDKYIHTPDCNGLLSENAIKGMIRTETYKGAINDDTANYVLSKLSGPFKRFVYTVKNPKEVQWGEAERIREEYNAYIKNLGNKAQTAAEAVVKAYVEDHSRLNHAYSEAESFDEFIGTCMNDGS
ncbi:MAG: hypothetical protein KAS04_02810 [Candidatus Aenigmarchaeota archaeon]|nr:hypothetical protein [Candidatus Aenigmarchaeota archaeon]